jgi:cytochrome c oxidase subunit 1
MFGGPVMAFVGGLFYWWPKITGRMYNEFLGRISALAVFVGFNLTFFPQFVMGEHGMPRRYYNYNPEFTSLHVLSTVGSFLLGLGFMIALFALLHGLFRGKKAPPNPWGGGSFEWQCASPPPHVNFEEPPEVRDPYDFTNLEYDEAEDCYRPAEAGAR